MKTKFKRFGKSAVSIVLSTLILFSAMIANAETIESRSSESNDTVSANTVTVDVTPDDKKTDTADFKKSDVKKTPEASGVGAGDNIYFIDNNGWYGANNGLYKVYIYIISENAWHEMAQVVQGSNIYYYTLTANYSNGAEAFCFTSNNNWTDRKQTQNAKFSTSNNVYYPTTSNNKSPVGTTQFSTLGFSIEDYDDTAKFYYNNTNNGYSDVTVYAWYETTVGSTTIGIKTTNYWPGTRMDKTLVENVYSAIVPRKTNKLIINNNGNGSQTGTLNVSSTNLSPQNPQMLVQTDNGGNWENTPPLASTTELKVILKNGMLRKEGYEKYSKMAESKFRALNGVDRRDNSLGSISISKGYSDEAEIATIPRGSTITFRTKIDSAYASQYYVKAFDINGETYFPTEVNDPTYVCEYTIPKDLAASYLEITPIFYYKENYDDRKFITFIVENFDDEVKKEWGRKIDNTEGVPILSCYAWYDHKKTVNGTTWDPDKLSVSDPKKSCLGGYPGQPMVYEDGHYTMQIPVTDGSGSHIQGVTLNNFVWDRVHSQVLGAYSDKERESLNCQTYDADDFVVLSKATPAPEFIVMSFKYRTNKNPHMGSATYDARSDGNRPSSDDSASLTLSHYNTPGGNGWDDYLDYNRDIIDLFNYILDDTEASRDPFYIVSDGYQEVYYGHFGTMWYIYDNVYNYVGKLPSSALLYTPTDTNGQALDLYTVMDSASRDAVPDWFLPFDSNTKYNPTISTSDRNTARTNYWKTYYDLYRNANSAKKHPAKITFETAIRAKDSGEGDHVVDPGLRNDVRWYYSRNSYINAEIKIEYKTSFDAANYTQDSLVTSGDGVSKPYGGLVTNAHAYFTNTSVQQLNTDQSTYSAVSIKSENTAEFIKSSEEDRFTFTADKSSEGTIGNENKTFVFEGWYRVIDGTYNKLSSSETLDPDTAKKYLSSSVDMRSSVTLVARYVPLSGDNLVITHDLYKDAVKYTNSPEALDGTGVPSVSVKVIDSNNNNQVIDIDCIELDNHRVAIDKTILDMYKADGYQLVVTLDVTPDTGNTYQTTYLKTLADGATAGTDPNGYYYEYNSANVTGPASAGTWNATKTQDQDQVIYTTQVSALLNTSGSTTSLKTNNIRFYSQLSAPLSGINADIKIEYKTSPTASTYTEDSFDETGSKPYAGDVTNAHAYFTNTSVNKLNDGGTAFVDTSIANEHTASGIQSSNDNSFAFEAEKTSVGTLNGDDTTFMFVGWYKLTDGTYTPLSTTERVDATTHKELVESSVGMNSDVTLVARYIPLSDETLTITHDLYKDAEKYTNSPDVLNGTGTNPSVSVKVIDSDNNSIDIPFEQTNDNQLTINKSLLDYYNINGYKLVVELDVTPDEDNTYETTYLKTLADGATAGTDSNGYYNPYDSANVTGPASAGTWNGTKTISEDQVVYTTPISDLLTTTTTGGTTTSSLKTDNIRFYSQLSSSKINIIFKYYDRIMASNSQPTNINPSGSSFTTTRAISTTGSNVQDKIDNTVGAGVNDLVAAKRVDNVIDEYYFWANQDEASTELKALTNLSKDYSQANLTYHTDCYGRVSSDAKYMSELMATDDVKNLSENEKNALKTEKWVTYKDIKGNEITSLSNVNQIASVEVWGFNYPKTYYMTFKDQGLSSTPINDNIYLASSNNDNYLSLEYYYNQRVGALEGTADDHNIIDDVSYHLTEYGISQNDKADIVVRAEDKNGYVFDGWYEKINNTYVKVSSDQTFGNRVTKTSTLIAGYRLASELEKKGITVTKNETEKYVDDNNIDRVRYVTVLNAYGFVDSDPNFNSVSVIYVKLPTDLDAEQSNLTIESLLADTTFTEELITALDSSRSDGKRGYNKSSVTVNVSNVDITSTTISYTYDIVPTYTDGTENTEITSGNQIKFTNKNRAQFVLDLKVSTVAEGASSSNLLVLSAVKYKDDKVTTAELTKAYKEEHDNADPTEQQLNDYLNSYLTSTYGTFISADKDEGYVYLTSDNYVVYNNNK